MLVECNIGEVTIFRRDKKPFTTKHFWVLWDFFCCVIEEFGESVPPSRIRARYFSPAAFRRWLGEAQLPW